jgi:hypothetical protein
MSRSRKPWTARRIHLWVAIVVAIPMLLMSFTGLLIALRSVTDLKVPMRWMGAETIPERLPITAYLETPDGVIWIGNTQGLYRVREGRAEAVADFAGQEIVGLAQLRDGASPVVATRMAVWTPGDHQWAAVRRGRVRQLANLPDGRVLVISGGRGEMADGKPMVSDDGQQWRPHMKAMQANKTLPPLTDPKVALHQFMRELHSGAYFFGKGPGEMTWSTVVGSVLALLSLTGLWMWVRVERQKARERRAAAAPASEALQAVTAVQGR